MKNTFGNSLTVTLFGESHGSAVGAVIDGIAPGIEIDKKRIDALLSLRRPFDGLSTARKEPDEYVIHSGVFENRTTGTPLCILIPNTDTRSKDYGDMSRLARPSHADYTAEMKYHGFQDYRGGGHFSGRITAALVAVGGILIPALEKKGIKIGTHIKRIGGISDRDFDNTENDINALRNMPFAVLDGEKAELMKQKILSAKAAGDSVGGVLESAVIGMPAGVGEPWFDTVEGLLSHALFSVPAVKGIEFGAGFAVADMFGSQANDPFCMSGDTVLTTKNDSGGINGGITNGMPIVFRTAIRPTPTISKEQQTVDIKNGTDAVLSAKGRHDPCIVHRARAVIDAVTTITLCDILTERFGTDWLAR